MSDVTNLLEAIERGDPKAAEQLLPLVYDELRELAALKLGDPDLRVREAAAKELLGFKELAYLILTRAAKSKDPGIKQRATALIHELVDNLPVEQLNLQEQDLILTTRFPISGRIEGPALKVRSSILGEGQLGLAVIRHMTQREPPPSGHPQRGFHVCIAGLQ